MSEVFSHDNENLLDLVICRAKDKISTELDGETVILNLISGTYSGLDQVGTSIWNFLVAPVRVRDIVFLVLNNYDVEEERCFADIIAFLDCLADNGLIEVSYAETY